MPQLRRYNWHGWEALINKDVGYYPYFSQHLTMRVNKKKATNIVVTGEPGEGKSYMASDIARILEGHTRSGKERFKLKQVVFTYKEYLGLIRTLRMGKTIVFDEPSYAMGKRDWYKELNKALVLTVESQRFKVHPLLIPIVNKALLDKTIRSYLIQFQIEMRDRGEAVVYRIYPSQHSEKIYRYTFCKLQYDMLNLDTCSKETCLDCKQLMTCPLFRARYERKKSIIQDSRYEQAADLAATKESKALTDSQIEIMLLEYATLFTNEDGKIDADLLRIVAKDKLALKIAHSHSYRLKKFLIYHYPERFET